MLVRVRPRPPRAGATAGRMRGGRLAGEDGGLCFPAVASLLPGGRGQRELGLRPQSSGRAPAPSTPGPLGPLEAHLLEASPQRPGPPAHCPPSLCPGGLGPLSSPPPLQKRQRRRRGRRPPRKVRWSSSSGDSSTASSGDSGDSEPEAALGALTGGQALLPTQHVVPDVDLWVPARQSARELWGGGPGSWPGPCGACPRPPEGSDPAQGGHWEACTTASAPAEPAGQARAASGTQSTSLRGIRCPCSTDARPSSSTGPARQVGHVRVGALLLGASEAALRDGDGLGSRSCALGVGADASSLHVAVCTPDPSTRSGELPRQKLAS